MPLNRILNPIVLKDTFVSPNHFSGGPFGKPRGMDGQRRLSSRRRPRAYEFGYSDREEPADGPPQSRKASAYLRGHEKHFDYEVNSNTVPQPAASSKRSGRKRLLFRARAMLGIGLPSSTPRRLWLEVRPNNFGRVKQDRIETSFSQPRLGCLPGVQQDNCTVHHDLPKTQLWPH